jgi:rhodanese-related sulfurtransferase
LRGEDPLEKSDDPAHHDLDKGEGSIQHHGKGFLRDDPVRRQPKDRVQTLTFQEMDAMPSTTAITVPQLSRLVGLPDAPTIVDVRIDEDYDADPRLLPASIRRDFKTVSTWASEFIGQQVAVICQKGQKLSQGVAAWLRHEGIAAESLEGGFEAWREAKGLLVKTDKIPPRDNNGTTSG